MTRKDENWLAWTLATIGLLGTGFAAGLHRLIWGLFLFLVVVWWIGCWYGMENKHDTVFWWILAIAPPIAIGFVLRIIEGIVFAFFGALNRLNDPIENQAKNDNAAS